MGHTDLCGAAAAWSRLLLLCIPDSDSEESYPTFPDRMGVLDVSRGCVWAMHPEKQAEGWPQVSHTGGPDIGLFLAFFSIQVENSVWRFHYRFIFLAGTAYPPPGAASYVPPKPGNFSPGRPHGLHRLA